MIKIKKSRTAPTAPNAKGACKLISESADNNVLYDATPGDYDLGTTVFDFRNDIYGHINVKTALINDQFGKCAFCEQNVISVAYGDVEHYRPKKGYSQNVDDSLNRPGYYWLAYDWSNLLFACQICNQRFKKNLFPLTNPEKRAKNHHNVLKAEKPFFVNPVLENPRQLIGFRKNVAYGKDKRHRGKKTIELLGLNREAKNSNLKDLSEIRLDYYDQTENSYLISKAVPNASVSQENIDKAQDLMRKFRSKKSQFSAMVNDNFPE